ncbi:TPA: hypothetical protein ND482_004641 [Citrobacter farmeri]|nr:hypothetical protein [Citrobacter farmeri]
MDINKLFFLIRVFIMVCIFTPKIVSAVTEMKTVTINGTTYNSCTISVENSELKLGDHPASGWSANNNWHTHNGVNGSRDIIINISACDVGTVIKLKGNGPNGGQGYLWWSKNASSGGSDNLYVAIALMKKGSDTEYTTLPLDNVTSRTYMTVSEADSKTTTKLKLRGTFRRINVNDVPVGKFSSTFTVIFTFE